MNLVIYMLWFWGEAKLTIAEIFEILEEYKLYGHPYNIYDVETLRKYINRLGLKKSTKTKIEWNK